MSQPSLARGTVKATGMQERLLEGEKQTRANASSLQRMEDRLSTGDAHLADLRRRQSELTGNVKGISDEQQSQIRRITELDKKIADIRRSSEDQIRNQFLISEEKMIKAAALARNQIAALEDTVKRQDGIIQRNETLVEEKVTFMFQSHDTLADLIARLQALEDTAAPVQT